VKKTKRKMSYMEYMMTQTTVGREIFFNLMTKEVDKNAKGFYPAPYEIMGVLKDNFQKPEIDYLKDEAKRFAKLAATPQSQALVGIFQGTSAVKKHSFGSPSHPVNTIAVLGAGLMGAGIATVSVDNGGYRVLLKDKDLAGVSRGEKIISDALAVKVTRKSMTESAFAEKTSRVIPLHDDIASWKQHFAKADMVIEGSLSLTPASFLWLLVLI
jgi:enoyl-CoA hydratase / long-chain 3-hydroxyacyl-CoA dehydrogenase